MMTKQERELRIGELANKIRQNEKEVYLDFNNPIHDEYFCLQLGGESHFKNEFPELYACYVNTKQLQKKNPNIVNVGEKDAFKDAAQIVYAYQDENHVLHFKGITALKHVVYHIGERIHIYHGADLVVATGRVTPNTHFTRYEFEWENTEEKYQSGQITYDYFSMWYSKQDSYLRAVIYSSDEEISKNTNSSVEAIYMENPIHKQTPENEEIVVCYNRTPSSGECVDYDYSEAFDPQSHKQQLFLEVDGEVTLKDAFKEFQWIDMTKFVLKLYCESGVASYSTEDRVEAIRNSFQKTDKGFSFHLDKDWKGVVPAARLPIVEDVEFLMRVPFMTDKGSGSILIDSTLAPEKTSGDKIAISKLHLLWGCVAGDTKVRMADGRESQIRDIQIGDRVLTKDGIVAEVRDIMSGMEAKLWHIETAQGHTINCSKEHPMYTDSGVKLAGDLCEADKLLNEENIYEEITGMYPVSGERVYSLILGTDKGSWIVTNGLFTGDFNVQNEILHENHKEKLQYPLTEELKKLKSCFE